MQKLTVKVPVYSFTCEVIFADPIEPEINKLRKKQKLEPIDGTVHGYAIGGNDVHTYYLFYCLKGLNVNTLAHEISHLVDYVFVDRGIEPPTGEPRAYLTGHVTEKIFEFVFKKQFPISKWLQVNQSKDEQPKQQKTEK